MTDASAVSSIPPTSVTDGEFQDDSLSADPVLQSETYIDAEPNVIIETPSLNKGVLLDDGNVPDLNLVPTETTLVMQRTTSVTEMVTPVHQVKRSTEVNVERPSLFLGDWKFETEVCTSITTGGTVDRPSETPQSKKQKSGSKTKEVTSFYFDSENPPESVSWVQMDSSADTWAPFVNGGMVLENQKQEWDAVFSSVSKLKGRNTQTGK